MRFYLAGIPRYFSFFMAFVYVVAGAFLIFSNRDIFSLNRNLKIGMGIVVLSYGFYRTYKAFQAIIKRNEE